MKPTPLEQALTAKVTLLGSGEISLRTEFFSELLAKICEEGDFDVDTFDAGVHSADEWVAGASTVPFLSEKRTGVVRNLLRFDTDDIAKLSEKLCQLPETARLILVADDEPSLGDKAATISAKWAAEVKKAGGVVLSFTVDADDMRERIQASAQKRKKSIRPKEIAMLLEMCGGNFSRAVDELEKLCIYVGDQEYIQEADLLAVVVPSREWKVYQLVDAALAGNTGLALREFQNLGGSSAKQSDAAFSRILPSFSRQLRMAWSVKVIKEKNESLQSPSAATLQLIPESLDWAKLKDWQIRKSAQLATRMSFDSMSSCFQALFDADSRLKGGLDGFSSSETLEQMIIEISSHASARP